MRKTQNFWSKLIGIQRKVFESKRTFRIVQTFAGLTEEISINTNF
jgi:hypothetical protein